MSPRSLVVLHGTILCCLALLATPGCGSSGNSSGSGDEFDAGSLDAVLLIENGVESTESVAVIRAVSMDASPQERVFDEAVSPGQVLELENLLVPGYYWVSVEFTSGFRTVPCALGVYEGYPATLWVARGAAGPEVLAGTWTGAYQEAIGTLHTLALTFDAVGAVTQVLVDALDASKTGSTTETSEGLFHVSFTDGSGGLLVCDDARAHAGIVFDDGAFGVLQRGAGPLLPGYASDDAVGTWNGRHVGLSTLALGVDDLRVANATVSEMGAWFDRDDLAKDFTGTTPFGIDSAAYGLFSCAYLDATATAGGLSVFLSADKTFAFGAYDPDVGVTFPEDLTFLALSKFIQIDYPPESELPYGGDYYGGEGYGYYGGEGYYGY